MEATVTPVLVAELLAEGERVLAGADVVVNTHHLHFDHCGGNHLFAGKPVQLDEPRTEGQRLDRAGPGAGLARARAPAVAFAARFARRSGRTGQALTR